MLAYYIFAYIYIVITFVIFKIELPLLRLDEIIGVTWLGVFTSAIAFVFWFLALKNGDSAKLSNLVFLTPFVSLVFIAIIVKEAIELSSVVGLILIVMGLILQNIGRKK